MRGPGLILLLAGVALASFLGGLVWSDRAGTDEERGTGEASESPIDHAGRVNNDPEKGTTIGQMADVPEVGSSPTARTVTPEEPASDAAERATEPDRRARPELEYMSEAESDSYAVLYRDAPMKELNAALRQCFERIPSREVKLAHDEVFERGDAEKLRDGSSDGSFAVGARNAEAMVPFVSVVTVKPGGTTYRTTIQPSDIPAYYDDVTHAVWIHFEKRRRMRQR